MISRRSFIKSALLLGLSIKTHALAKTIEIKEFLNRVVTIDISEESTEGGEIKCFLENNELVKITKEQYWESGRYKSQILLRNGQIHIVKDRIEKYNVPFYITEETAKELGLNEFHDMKLSNITSNTYYFSNGSAKYGLSNSGEHSSNKDLLKITKEYSNELTKLKEKASEQNA